VGPSRPIETPQKGYEIHDLVAMWGVRGLLIPVCRFLRSRRVRSQVLAQLGLGFGRIPP
jgi:hypothetical protein